MYTAFRNWQYGRNFDYGFRQAVNAQQGITERSWHRKTLETLAPIGYLGSYRYLRGLL
jgi:hypothetical protein